MNHSFEASNSKLTPSFQAEYTGPLQRSPADKGKQITYNIASTLVFPIGATRLVKHSFQILSGKAILPAQNRDAEKQETIHLWYNFAKKRGLFEEIALKTPDGATLEGIYVTGKDNDGNAQAKDGPTLIYFNGNDEDQIYNGFFLRYVQRINSHSKRETALDAFLNAGYNVIFFNYRGVGLSEGCATRQRLILDGETAYQYAAHHLQVKDKDILLYGHSLGGGIANEIAALHPQVNLCNERSFSCLKKEVKVLLNHNIATPIGSVAAVSIAALGWNFNSEKAWQKVKGKKLIVVHEQDSLIPKKARLFDTLIKSNEKSFQEIAAEAKTLFAEEEPLPLIADQSKEVAQIAYLKIVDEEGTDGIDAHNRSLNAQEAEIIARFFTQTQ